jgi:hypothetical protein
MDSRTATVFLATIAENISTAPFGRPQGEVYALLMAAGVDLPTFNKLMHVGDKMGVWTSTSDHRLFLTDKGRLLVDKLEGVLKVHDILYGD